MIDFQKAFPEKWDKLRKDVFKRDKNTCQFINNGKKCKHKKLLQVHHIFKKSEFPSMVWDIDNCITLCIKHHKEISGRENDFVHVFKKIVRENNAKKNS